MHKGGETELSFQFGNFGSLRELQNSKALRSLVDLSFFDERFALENLHGLAIDPLEDAMDSFSKLHTLIACEQDAAKAEAQEGTGTAQQQQQQQQGRAARAGR